MKRRIRRTVNFLAFNLLFFSLYLNFIHKDKDAGLDPVVQNQASTPVQAVKAPAVEKNTEVVKSAIN